MSSRYPATHRFCLKNHLKTPPQTRLCSSLPSGAKLKKGEMEVELDKKITFKETSNKEYSKDFPVVRYITYSEFFENFLMKNQACLIRCISTKWESKQKWVAKGNIPNFKYLTDTYGDSDISVHDCNQTYDYYSTKPIEWKLRNYMNYWEEYISLGYPKEKPLYYLKDWHLKNQRPDDNFYELPIIFASDWLNEYLVDIKKDDYRFIYMGVKGTWSPFHVDVMTSYSWSSNICGQKRWILFPPGDEQPLRDRLGNLPHDISNVKHEGKKPFEVLQNPGDAIFVPSNWHHQVWNTKNTISINHNWINGCNLHNIWQNMEKNLVDIKNEIKDCQDMDDFLEHCQVMLRSSFGMNFRQFYEFVSYIASKRVCLLRDGVAIKLPENRTLGRNHALFDLQAIHYTLTKLIDHEDLLELTCFRKEEKQLCSLMKDIANVIGIKSKPKSS